MTLTTISTHEELGAFLGKVPESTIIQVPDSLINEVQIDVDVGPACLFTKARNCRYIGV